MWRGRKKIFCHHLVYEVLNKLYFLKNNRKLTQVELNKVKGLKNPKKKVVKQPFNDANVVKIILYDFVVLILNHINLKTFYSNVNYFNLIHFKLSYFSLFWFSTGRSRNVAVWRYEFEFFSMRRGWNTRICHVTTPFCSDCLV